MRISLTCEDKYESQKLSSLIFIKDSNETYITKILNIIDNEVVVELKDKSAHSVLLKDEHQVEKFADFIQSVIEKKHKITSTIILEQDLEIVKEWTYKIIFKITSLELIRKIKFKIPDYMPKAAQIPTAPTIAIRLKPNALKSPIMIKGLNYYN